MLLFTLTCHVISYTVTENIVYSLCIEILRNKTWTGILSYFNFMWNSCNYFNKLIWHLIVYLISYSHRGSGPTREMNSATQALVSGIWLTSLSIGWATFFSIHIHHKMFCIAYHCIKVLKNCVCKSYTDLFVELSFLRYCLASISCDGVTHTTL